MMYEVAHRKEFGAQLNDAISLYSKYSNIIKTAMSRRRIDFEKDVIDKLCSASRNKANFVRHLKSLINRNLLAVDDYSISIMTEF